MLWQAKYPYLVNLGEYARREHDYYGPIEELLEDDEALRLSAKRLAIVLESGELPDSIGGDTWEEVLSFHSALAAVAKSGSLRLLKRFSEAEARRARRFISRETREGVVRLARSLGLRVYERRVALNWLYSPAKGVIPRLLQYAVNLPDYLSVASQVDEPRLKLVNSFLLEGLVYMDRTLLEELLLLKIKIYIEDLAGAYSELTLPRLEELGKKTASRIDWRTMGKFDPAKIPPCIREIVNDMKNGVTPTQGQFYMLVTFLANTGAPPEYLEELLYSSKIAPRALTSLMADILLDEARNYKPYTCDVALREKICSECRGKGPLSEYIASTRRHRD
ncbi:MAG: hypothetical protein F7C38_03360 [Desulfurococcales archaeon]|nr:hypothetical protein [Desulfurococcales archaeon]